MRMPSRDAGNTAPAFGSLLKTYRTQAGISQEELAERAGVSASAIGALEQGLRRAPYRQTIVQLSEALRLTDEDRKQLRDAADAARARKARAVRTAISLPTPFTSFVDRAEVDEIAELLERRRFVTITGAGGIGKTRTALAAALRLAQAGADCRFVDLSAVTDIDGIWTAIAGACEMPAIIGEAPESFVAGHLAARSMLLVLDNCEHLVDDAAHVARTLLAATPSLRLLATSRERLGLTSELVFRLPSMTTAIALQLLVERAEASDAHAHEALTDSELLREICRLLEGIPLAIELAAFHLTALGPEVVRARLIAGLALLGPRDLPQRHQTMTAAIAWSFDLLDTRERAVIERLGVFAGGFTIESAQYVCADDLVSPLEAESILLRLVQKSLVRVEQTGGSVRYSLLETVRTYALQELERRGGADAARRRHLERYVQIALAFSNARPRRSTTTLYREMENIRSALQWAIASDRGDDALAAGTIVGRLRLVWYTLERSAELQSWAGRLLARLRTSGDDGVLAHLYAALVNCAQRIDPEASIRYGEDAIRLAERSGDLELAASIRGQIAIPLVQRGRAAEAEALLAACDTWLESAAASGRHSGLTILFNRANVRRRLENFDAARADLQRILDSLDAAGDVEHRCKALMQLAAIEFSSGDARTARRMVTTLIDELQPPNDVPSLWLAIAYGELGSYALALGDWDEAELRLRISVQMLRELNASCEVFFLYLGAVHEQRGDWRGAATMLGFVDAWYQRTGFAMDRHDAQFRDSLAAALSNRPERECDTRRQAGSRMHFDQLVALIDG